MKTIWFIGKDENELTSIAEVLGEALINKDQYVEIIVESEVQEILGRGLKDTPEDRSTFTDRLGFLGNLLHRNNIFVIIIAQNASLMDRKSVKESYKNYIQINLENKDELCDLFLDKSSDPNSNAKKIIEYLDTKKMLPSQGEGVYSKDEEEEIRRRLEELGYV